MGFIWWLQVAFWWEKILPTIIVVSKDIIAAPDCRKNKFMGDLLILNKFTFIPIMLNALVTRVAWKNITKKHEIGLEPRSIKTPDIKKQPISCFCMSIYVWEKLVRSGSRICPLSTKNNNLFEPFRQNKFFLQYMTMDETWQDHCNQQLSRQSVAWAATGESHAKRPKKQKSTGKVIASIF